MNMDALSASCRNGMEYMERRGEVARKGGWPPALPHKLESLRGPGFSNIILRGFVLAGTYAIAATCLMAAKCDCGGLQAASGGTRRLDDTPFCRVNSQWRLPTTSRRHRNGARVEREYMADGRLASRACARRLCALPFILPGTYSTAGLVDVYQWSVQRAEPLGAYSLRTPPFPNHTLTAYCKRSALRLFRCLGYHVCVAKATAPALAARHGWAAKRATAARIFAWSSCAAALTHTPESRWLRMQIMVSQHG